MPTTYPLATLGPTINEAGVSIPTYDDVYQSLQASFQVIYGNDAYLDPDSQDGQLLAVFAKAIHDTNQAVVSMYRSFSPATAVGDALSSNVKINGITRKVASKSQVQVTLTGVANTLITNGVVEDLGGQKWALPASVVIPTGGSITVTATCQDEGAVEVGVGQVTRISTPTLGWQAVTNPAFASLGAPVETDAQLRLRQASSVSVTSLSVMEALRSAVAAVPNVQMLRVYENDTGAPDSNGLPAHSISVVAYGGASADLASVIRLKKTPGAATYGSTTVAVPDELGDLYNISFFYAAVQTIKVKVQITPLGGYVSSTDDLIKQAIVDYINSLAIGQRVDQGRLYLPAQLYGAGELFKTFEINGILLSISPAVWADADVTIAFNALARTDLANITLEVV